MRIRLAVAVGAITLAATTMPLASPAFQSSPTATMRAYHDAAVKKDAAALEKLISSASLKMLENPDVPIGRLLLAMTREVPDAVPGMRNEKITGVRASLEVENTKYGRWDTALFVKEDGAWKLALDEMDQKK